MTPAAPVRPFRFAVVAARVHDARSWRDLCHEVEDLGFAALYLPDTSGPQLGPLAALGAAAAHTDALRLGMLVADNGLRHPAVLAKELATLDVLSSGRLDWGVGAGWSEPDHRAVGVPFPAAGERVDRVIEAVDLVRAIFSGAPVTHRGRHYATVDLAGTPVPVQRPHPPLLVGAAARRLLTFAGANADVVGINRSFSAVPFGGRPPRRRPDEAVAAQVAWVAEGAAGRPGPPELSMEVDCPVTVTDDRRGALDRLARARGRAPDEVAADPRTWVGSLDGIVDAVLATRERFGVSHWVVYEQDLRTAAPVVARLAGR